tara:strand:- start:534 stop:1160 length:627 start_codon:yes stop_codon:yes gene_type:complete
MALVKYNNNSISAVTSTGLASGVLTLIKTLTASASATLSFVDGTDGVVLDSTYPIYKFEFINIHPSASSEFYVNFRDGGSAYDATKTTTVFRAAHKENDASSSLSYNAAEDLAQSTAFQALTSSSQIGTDNDECASGEMTLFNPSSTTFVKHFIAKTNYVSNDADPNFLNCFTAGYCNVTAAIDGVQFKMGSGNIDSGKIKLYGIKDS